MEVLPGLTPLDFGIHAELGTKEKEMKGEENFLMPLRRQVTLLIFFGSPRFRSESFVVNPKKKPLTHPHDENGAKALACSGLKGLTSLWGKRKRGNLRLQAKIYHHGERCLVHEDPH